MEKLSNATAMDSSVRFQCVKTNEVEMRKEKREFFFFFSFVEREKERESVYKGRNYLLFFFIALQFPLSCRPTSLY